jgi:hypothetical protein
MGDELKPAHAVWPSEQVRDEALNAYYLAVGKASYAWNDLHERLADLYVMLTVQARPTPDITEAADPRGAAFSKWYKPRNDGRQRRMLRGLIKVGVDDDRSACPTAGQDILWLLDSVDNLAKERNDAVHAPVSLYIDTREGGSAEVRPANWNGNPRAASLVGRKLLEEFERCQETATLLSDFTAAIQASLMFPNQVGRPRCPKLPVRLGAEDVHEKIVTTSN